MKESVQSIQEILYTTDKSNYLLWPDRVFSDNLLKISIRLLIYCLIPFISGLIIASKIDFEVNYLNTIPIYLGIFGIILTFSIILYGSSAIHKNISLVRPCFTITDESYRNEVLYFFKLCTSNKHTIIVILSILFYAIIALCITFNKFGFNNHTIEDLSNSLFGKLGWYDETNKHLKFLILLIYAIFCSLPLGTAAWMLFVNFRLVAKLFKLPVIPVPNLIYSRLESLTDFYLKITIAWFFGVTLFVLVFVKNLNFLSSSFIIILSIFGIVTFLTPQLLYRRLIEKSRSEGTRLAFQAIYKNNNIEFIETNHESNVKLDRLVIKELFENKNLQLNISDVISVEQKWIYNPLEILTFIVSQAFPFLVVYLKQLV